jgi:HSP20 family molecular chaperone IbpA
MTTHIIHIIREMADHGGRSSKTKAYYCSDLKAPIYSYWEPNADIFESEELVHISMELAGVSRTQVCVHLKAGELIVTGIRMEKRPDEKVYYHQLELNYGHFKKVITLPESVEHNDITATLHDGLLEIKISKRDRAIEIPITGMQAQA